MNSESANSSLSSYVIAFLPIGNVTFPSMETFLRKLGSPKLIDTLYVSLYLPTCCIGIVLNIISMLIFRKKGFDLPLYSYIRTSVFCGLCINLIQFIFVFLYCRHYFQIANSFWANAYIVYVFTPLIRFLVFYKFLIDLAIAIDRIAALSLRVKSFCKLSPFSVQLVMLIFAICIHIFFFFYFEAMKIKVLFFEDKKMYLTEIFYLKYTFFNNSLAGKIIFNAVFVITHGVYLTVEVFLNIITFVLFKRYLSKQKELKNHVCIKFAIDGSRATNKANYSLDKKITWMCIALSLLSGFHQILLNTCLILTVLSTDPEFASGLYFVTNYSNNLRNVIGFFVFYWLNVKFRNCFNRCVKKIGEKFCSTLV
jgi:hypothetical protein